VVNLSFLNGGGGASGRDSEARGGEEWCFRLLGLMDPGLRGCWMGVCGMGDMEVLLETNLSGVGVFEG
jgi:hypothetical protein